MKPRDVARNNGFVDGMQGEVVYSFPASSRLCSRDRNTNAVSQPSSIVVKNSFAKHNRFKERACVALIFNLSRIRHADEIFRARICSLVAKLATFARAELLSSAALVNGQADGKCKSRRSVGNSSRRAKKTHRRVTVRGCSCRNLCGEHTLGARHPKNLERSSAEYFSRGIADRGSLWRPAGCPRHLGPHCRQCAETGYAGRGSANFSATTRPIGVRPRRVGDAAHFTGHHDFRRWARKCANPQA